MASVAGAGPPELVVPDGWLVDELAEQRLRHQLDRAAAPVVGVVAPVVALPPGATYRALAARRSLLAMSATVGHGTGDIEGAVLLRDGVTNRSVPGGIHVNAGEGVLVSDPGAPSFDPRVSEGPLESATSESRSPFPCRPVVVFLACTEDGETVDWAQSMVNELVDLEVDACLAATRSPEGRHLARPCRADRQSIVSLRPDVVVTLDDAARAELPGWIARQRRTLVIDHDPDPAVAVDVVGRRLGAGGGRVRALAGRAARSDELAAVIGRLCDGPHPLTTASGSPPGGQELRDDLGVVVATIAPRRRLAAPGHPSVRVVTIDGSPSSPTDPTSRVGALADRLDGSGHRVSVSRAGGEPHVDLTCPDAVVLHGVRPTGAMFDAIEGRSLAGRATILWLAPDDVEVVVEGATRGLRLGADARRLAEACGRVIAPSRQAADLVDDPMVAVIALPPLIARAEEEALRREAAGAPPVLRKIGWQIDQPSPGELAAAEGALTSALDEWPDLTLEVAGSSVEQMDVAARHRSRVRSASSPLVRHASDGTPLALLWTVDDLHPLRRGDVGPLVEAGYAGVPTLVSVTNAAAGWAVHPPALRIHDPLDADAWFLALGSLLGDPALWESQRAAVRRSVDSVFGEPSAGLVVSRFVGWLRSRSNDAS